VIYVTISVVFLLLTAVSNSVALFNARPLGLRTAPLAEVFPDQVRIPTDHVIGTPGSGFLVFDRVMKWEILCGFAVTLGEMQHRLERCVEYACNRCQFGTNIRSYQAVSHRIVNMKIDVETARKWVYSTADRIIAREEVATDIATTKLIVSEANLRSAFSAVQIFGGYGYTTEYGIEKEVRSRVRDHLFWNVGDLS
jgi:L-prolyl-PCP dehydrogenase